MRCAGGNLVYGHGVGLVTQILELQCATGDDGLAKKGFRLSGVLFVKGTLWLVEHFRRR
jgi:hypothetical protein